MNAFRLLLDLPNPVPPRTHLWIEGEPEQYADMMEKNYGYKSLLKLALDPAKPAEPRIAAMWILGRRDADVLMLGYGWSKGVFADKDPVVRRNAALISELPHYAINQGQQSFNFLTGDLIPLLSDPDAQTRLAALRALGSTAYDDTVAKALIAAWPKFDDDFQKSAAIGAASRNSAGCIAAALAAPDPSSLTPLINNLVSRLAEASDSAAAVKLVIALADKPASGGRPQGAHPRHARQVIEEPSGDDPRVANRAHRLARKRRERQRPAGCGEMGCRARRIRRRHQ